MTIEFVLQPKVLFYEPHELDRWKVGDREQCSDSFCRRLGGSGGFGEYLVGRHFESLGYQWIHHDFDLFGSNKLGKYPKSEDLLARFFCPEAREIIRSFHRSLKPFRLPGKFPLEQ